MPGAAIYTMRLVAQKMNPRELLNKNEQHCCTKVICQRQAGFSWVADQGHIYQNCGWFRGSLGDVQLQPRRIPNS